MASQPENGIMESINDRLGSIADVSKGIDLRMVRMETRLDQLPDEKRVRSIVSEEQQKCRAHTGFDDLAKSISHVDSRTAQNTGVIETIRDTGVIRRSIAPAANVVKKIPRWAQATIGVTGGIGAIAVAIREIVQRFY